MNPRLSGRALAGLAALGFVAAACRKTPPEPAGDSQDGAPGPATSVQAPSRLPRDDAGHLIPRTPPPSETIPTGTKPTREPDWDLDSDDAARDYVRRYTLGTKRYGETLDCADIGPSQPAGDKRRVEVKGAANCPEAGTTRDVFLVDVPGDRLTVDDKSKRKPLARWPDGSDPEGPPGQAHEITSIRDWKSPLKDAIQSQLLVPIRMQTYGRGSYPVITIAGWHAAVVPGAGPDALQAFAGTMCRASGGAPLGVFAGVDRSLMLRVRCPQSARWDKL